MSYQLKIDPRISEQYPGYTALIIYAQGLSNGPSDIDISLRQVGHQAFLSRFAERFLGENEAPAPSC